MTELWRSFKEKLDVDNRSGIVVYSDGKNYEVEFLDVRQDIRDIKMIFPITEEITDWDNFDFAGKREAIVTGREKGRLTYMDGLKQFEF